MEEQLAHNPDNCLIIENWKQAVSTAVDLIHTNGGGQSRELIAYITEGSKDNLRRNEKHLKAVLEYAGFEMVKKYRPLTRKTDRVWALKEEYKYYTLGELYALYENRIIDYILIRNLF